MSDPLAEFRAEQRRLAERCPICPMPGPGYTGLTPGGRPVHPHPTMDDYRAFQRREDEQWARAQKKRWWQR